MRQAVIIGTDSDWDVNTRVRAQYALSLILHQLGRTSEADEWAEKSIIKVPQEYEDQIGDPKQRLRVYDLMTSIIMRGRSTGVWEPRTT